MTDARPTKRPAAKPRRITLGAMAIVGSLLVFSALLRLTVGAGAAFARETETAVPPVPPPATTQESTDRILTEADLENVLDALREREERLEKNEDAVAVRMRALEIAEEAIDRKLAQLQSVEEQLRSTIALAQTAAEDDLTRLTDVYASMKPKQAAALFEAMDAEFAAGFLGRMRPDTAAAIMAGLSPTAAYSISVILAGRNADVPKE